MAAVSADKVTMLVDSVRFSNGPLDLSGGCLTFLCFSRVSTRLESRVIHLESDVDT